MILSAGCCGCSLSQERHQLAFVGASLRFLSFFLVLNPFLMSIIKPFFLLEWFQTNTSHSRLLNLQRGFREGRRRDNNCCFCCCCSRNPSIFDLSFNSSEDETFISFRIFIWIMICFLLYLNLQIISLFTIVFWFV